MDSVAPHELADWWADALGWQVEPSDEAFISRMVAEGHATEDQTMTHNGVLVWTEGQAIRHPDEPAYPRVLFVKVPEQKSLKNRLHLDVRVGKERIEAELERLSAKGATFLHRGSQGPNWWVTLADPQGNELCLS